ncbi:MAG: sigma-70 family RNA polymerase sigma factor [Kofleriaceae bacterium]|nr:sigma-70 family RNA polymerase sigma factor [Kofleriaceae bacterium]
MSVPDTKALEAAAEAALRAAARAGLSEIDGRDVAQEALLRALTSTPPPAGVSLPAWAYGIARNLCRDHQKSAQRREGPAEMVNTPASDEDLATVLTVRRAVDELPEPLRDIITLHELEEHTLADTARALQIPFDTAKDRLRRAREQLRARLGDSEAAVARERSHSRRRAAAQGAAIVAAVYATIGQRALAAGFGANAAATSTAAGANATTTAAKTDGFAVRGWIAGTVATAMLAGGFVVGRMTAPEPASAPRTVVVERERVEPEPPSAVAPTSPPTAVAPAEVQPSTAVAPAQVQPSSRTVAPAHAPPTTVASATPPAPVDRDQLVDAAISLTVDATQAERLLLDRARAGLQRGMPDEALVTLMSHERQFPAGKLAEERDVMIVEAYVRAGNAALARKRIAAYEAAYPNGVLKTRVAALAAQL